MIKFLPSLLCFSALALGPQKIEVQGHRGARGLRPENTLPAFELALSLGVDTLELDLAVTKDDVLVISHDPGLNPEICLDAKGAKPAPETLIRNLTYEQLKTYDCGSLKHSRFPDQVLVPKTPIPRFQDLIDWLKNSKDPRSKTIQLNIEAKIFPARPEVSPDPKAFANLILDLLKKENLIDRSVLQCFDVRVLRAARSLNSKIQLSQLVSENHLDLVDLAKSSGAQIISPHHEWILKEDVQKLRKKGIKIIPWTANDPKSWQRLKDLEVDGIITDYPDRLIEFLKQK